MLSNIVCLGISHRKAPVAVREALCLSKAAIHKLHSSASCLRGFALLSTCNRVEFYVERGRDDVRTTHEVISGLLPPGHSEFLDTSLEYVYQYVDVHAAQHLARVASGMDSLVLGESQIQGQVQDCFRRASQCGTASSLLSLVFQVALKVGARVRNETALARNPTSVASVAVDLARTIAGPLKHRNVAVLGAGEMGRMTAQILSKNRTQRLIIVNRTESRANKVAAATGAEALPLTALKEAVEQVDIVFCTIRGEGVVLDINHLEGRNSPLLVMDLAVPRNALSAIQHMADVRLVDMDGLRTGVDASLARRRAEVPKAEAIVAEEMDLLQGQVRALTIEPVIRNLRRKAEVIRQQELARALRNLNGLLAEDEACLQQFSQRLVNKILHDPTTRRRERATAHGAAEESDLIRALFAL